MDNRVPGSQWEGTELADQRVAFGFHLNMLNSGSYSVVTSIPASRSSLSPGPFPGWPLSSAMHGHICLANP